MEKRNNKFDDLRIKAEELLSDKKGSYKKLGYEMDELIHELEVYQLELEMQNDNLKKIQIELEDSRKEYFELYNFAPVGYLSLDENGIIKKINLTGTNILEKDRKFLLNSAFINYINRDYRKTFYKHCKEVRKSQDKKQCTVELKTEEINPIFVTLDTMPIFKEGKLIELRTVITDITESKKAEIELHQALDEKEMLLREIHHRVKNNLMIISSLLNLQSRYIKDKTSLNVFKESQNRARSMALIHERLYQSSDLKRIDFGEYIRSLSNELFHTYRADTGYIKLKIDVENILLDINTAIPLGLIVNELVTNSLEHAFLDGESGEINIEFHSINDHYEFIVQDNGIGFPEELDFRNTESLGLQIVNSLISQIDGDIQLDCNGGTKVKIEFKDVIIN